MPSSTPRRASSRWLVHLLRCSDGSLYTGVTHDVPKRLKTHAAGKASRYTHSRLPVKLAYSGSKSAALNREAATERLRRAEKHRLLDLCGRKNAAYLSRALLPARSRHIWVGAGGATQPLR